MPAWVPIHRLRSASAKMESTVLLTSGEGAFRRVTLIAANPEDALADGAGPQLSAGRLAQRADGAEDSAHRLEALLARAAADITRPPSPPRSLRRRFAERTSLCCGCRCRAANTHAAGRLERVQARPAHPDAARAVFQHRMNVEDGQAQRLVGALQAAVSGPEKPVVGGHPEQAIVVLGQRAHKVGGLAFLGGIGLKNAVPASRSARCRRCRSTGGHRARPAGKRRCFPQRPVYFHGQRGGSARRQSAAARRWCPPKDSRRGSGRRPVPSLPASHPATARSGWCNSILPPAAEASVSGGSAGALRAVSRNAPISTKNRQRQPNRPRRKKSSAGLLAGSRVDLPVHAAHQTKAGASKFGQSAEKCLQAVSDLKPARGYPSAIFAHHRGIEQPRRAMQKGKPANIFRQSYFLPIRRLLPNAYS